ncbi:hypothetical protein [Paraburkholderia youngii]|uniref:hypothetical protein n=1 Tax=Paraburkholderia youngii TaxID=2782701 RepID=UPI003D1BFF63
MHAPLGLAVWLSLYVPIAPKSWDQRAIRWMTLRLLVQACMDSFRFFLMEAMDAGERRQILWLPFPIHEFPERMTLVRGGTDQDNSLGVCALLRGNAGLGQWPASVPSAGDHYCRHTLQLRKNVDPMSAS